MTTETAFSGTIQVVNQPNPFARVLLSTGCSFAVNHTVDALSKKFKVVKPSAY